MPDRPLSPLMQACLRAMLELEDRHVGQESFTPNQIGYAAGAKTVHQHKWRSGVKGPAQQIIRPLMALRDRGLVHHAQRPDGMSGTAYALTDQGHEVAGSLQ